MERKLVIFVCGFAFAILALQYFAENTIALIISGAVLLAAAVVLFILKFRRQAFCLLLGAVLAVSWLAIYPMFRPISNSIDGGVYGIEATASGYSAINSKGTGITCKINIKSIDGNALKTPIRSIAYINSTEYTLSPGDSITATANIELVKNTRDFAGFAYYKTRYIDATAFIKSDKPIKTNKSGEFRFKYIPEYISNAIQKKLDLMLPKDEAAFVKALVVGERSDMSVSSQEDLRIIGLTHIVSVSGMHVAFLAFFIILLVGKRRAPFIVLPILVLFTLVVGGTPAIIRALIMQAIILLAPIFRREADGPTTLMFSLFVILMLNPYAACDIGLQLSFLSTLGLMLFSGRINRNLMASITIKNRFLRKIIGVSVSTFAASTSAILFTVPLIAYIFHEVSLISPIANVLILWLINGAFLVSVIAVSVSFIWLGLAKVIIFPAYLMCKGALWSSSLLADVPFASVYVGNIYAVLLILYLYVILFLLYKFRREKGIPLIPICCVVLAISVTAVCIVQSQMLGDGIRLSILDVGQGQCVIGEGHGATVMIDCGGSRDKNSGDIAREYLRHVGVSSLDALILTHVHTDHTNGVVRFMQKFKVTDLYLPYESRDDVESRRITDTAKQVGTNIHFIKKNTELLLADMRVNIYHTGWKSGLNENGLAIMVSKDDFDCIITGDLPKTCEHKLASSNKLPDTEVYVVGHHGSKTSSSIELLNTILPELAVISVGLDNSYGHPSDSVLGLFSDMGINVLRTDLEQDIILDSSVITTK